MVISGVASTFACAARGSSEMLAGPEEGAAVGIEDGTSGGESVIVGPRPSSILLYGHGGSANHGCEAIVRSTVDLVGGRGVPSRLVSMRPDEDLRAGLAGVVEVIDQECFSPLSPWQYVATAVSHKLTGSDERFWRFKNAAIAARTERDTVALSIGGDNYCYGDRTWLYVADEMIRRRGARNLLWGCSIEPSSIDKAMIRNLEGFDRIVARESITRDALVDRGLKTPISLLPDPAFCLQAIDGTLPPGFIEGETVGINLSPLAISHERGDGLLTRAVLRMVERILAAPSATVALIPHVVRSDDDDRIAMEPILRQFASTQRVVSVPEAGCQELKGIIARCRAFVGARTHATIAAYSSGVPTMALGYSVKARGIARDLFGVDEGVVVPIATIDDEGALVRAWDSFLEREKECRERLRSLRASWRQVWARSSPSWATER